jgi:hypothetical protein
MITVDQPRLLDDGGASFQFAAQLLPADLGENGLTAEIFLLGKDTPLTSISFRRADFDDLTKRIVEFEARLAQISQSTAFRFKTVKNDLNQRLDMMQQRIDTFIEYAASFMFDRIAASEVATMRGGPPLSPELRSKVDTFRRIVRGEQPDQRSASHATDPLTAAVPLKSAAFSFGWHEAEVEDGVALRRMSDNAIVFNPHPERPVAAVHIALSAGQGAAQPALRAAFDGEPAALVIERAKRRADGWRVRITPPKGPAAAKCDALSLANMLPVAPVRANGTDDARQRSVAVTELTFTYAADGAVSDIRPSHSTGISNRIA